MKVEKEADIIKIAAREMLKGSKMLGEHCKVCGFPLFEDSKGNKYCVCCNIMKEMEEKDKEDKDNKKEINEKKEEVSSPYNQDIYIKIVEEKIDYLFKRLEGECDIARIVEITDAIKALLKLKSKLE